MNLQTTIKVEEAPQFTDFDIPDVSLDFESTLIAAYEAANDQSRISTPPGEWAFVEVAWPLVERASLSVLECFETVIRDDLIAQESVNAIFSSLITPLWKNIFAAVSRCMTVELAAAKQTGLLAGKTETERFNFFIDCLRDPEFSLPLLLERPALSALLVAICENWKFSTILFLNRLRGDWPIVRQRFLDEHNHSKLTTIFPSQGDTHRYGQSVIIVEAEGGQKLLYKPRSVATEVHFNALANWINQTANEQLLKTVEAIDMGDYGWCEYVAHEPIKSKTGLNLYHKRLGILLAIARTLRVTDLHSENIVANGDWPVLIDLETIFHPPETYLRPKQGIAHSEKGLCDVVAQSVQSTGMLPSKSFDPQATDDALDLAGMADVEDKQIPFGVPIWEDVGTDNMRLGEAVQFMEGNKNIPIFEGERIRVERYKEDILNGFSHGYTFLMTRKQELIHENGPLAIFKNDNIRIVIRATQIYIQLLTEGAHPDLLVDFDDKTNWLNKNLEDQQNSDLERKLAGAELAAFMRNDVPYFETTPTSRDIVDCSGKVYKNLLPKSGWECVCELASELDVNDLQFQLWLIEAALHEKGEMKNLGKPQISADHLKGDLKSLATNVAEKAAQEIHAFATMRLDDASWLTLRESISGNVCIEPAGLDLYNGLPGIALFLGKAGTHLQNPKFHEAGGAALNHILKILQKGQFEGMSHGGYTGSGGLLFALSCLVNDYPDLPLLEALDDFIQSIRLENNNDCSLEIVDGLAGFSLCIVAAINNIRLAQEDSQSTITNLEELLFQVCETIRKRLQLNDQVSDLNLNSDGYAHGYLGLRASVSVLKRFPNSAIQTIASDINRMMDDANLVEQESSKCCHSPIAWCRGVSGTLLGEFLTGKTVTDDAAKLINQLNAGNFSDDCLCHGSMGAIHVLNSIKSALPNHLQQQLNETNLLILARLNAEKPISGTIGNVFSPGFMDGVSGIGYAALSLLEPDNIPNALMLGAEAFYPATSRPE